MKIEVNQVVNWSIRISIFFTLCSCNTTSQKLLKEMTLLQSKPINCGQNELVHHDTLQKEIKCIVYSDSVSCTPCAINKMYLWNSFLDYSKSYNGQLNFYFILCPARKDFQEMKLALIKNSRFNYPIILDTLGQFAKLNPHLPKNKALHTFLLDENNNVILVGNPLHNKKIKEMFYRIVEDRLGKPE